MENGDTEYNIKHFEEVLNRELGVIPEGRYNYVKDIKDAYKTSLATSTEEKILANIPDHAFWDIKKPQKQASIVRMNKYNPFRGREFNNFFEMRDSEQYLEQ